MPAVPSDSAETDASVFDTVDGAALFVRDADVELSHSGGGGRFGGGTSLGVLRWSMVPYPYKVILEG